MTEIKPERESSSPTIKTGGGEYSVYKLHAVTDGQELISSLSDTHQSMLFHL